MVADVPWNSRDKGTGNRTGRPQHQRSIPMLIIARSHLSPVATCRQTVEATLAPPKKIGNRDSHFSCSYL